MRAIAFLPLPLLVLLVRADDVHHPVAAHHLALDADLLDRRPYFHKGSSLTSGGRSGRGSCRRGRAPGPRGRPATAGAGSIRRTREPPRSPGPRSPAPLGRARWAAPPSPLR